LCCACERSRRLPHQRVTARFPWLVRSHFAANALRLKRVSDIKSANEEEMKMKKLLLLGASALLFASLVVDEASAQRGMGGGFRGGGFGGGGFRGGFGGGGFRAANIGGGFRGGFAGGGFRAANVGGFRGAGWAGRPVGWGGWGGRRVGWGGWGWRRGWGWPVAAGVGLGVGLATAGYYGSCWRWDGWTWVNVCYAPAYYGYGYPYY